MTIIDESQTIDHEPALLLPRAEPRELTATATTLIGLVRIALGWTFLWGFVDKFFGLGFDTCRTEEGTISAGCDAAFVNGGSPTFGFLNFATNGSKTGDLFSWMAPSAPNAINLTDVLFMAGLFAVGVSLMLGIAVRFGGIAGAAMMLFIYLAGFVWPEFNPIVDQHIVQGLACLALAALGAGRWLGLGRRWADLDLVQRFPVLR